MTILWARIHLDQRKQSYDKAPSQIAQYSNHRRIGSAPVTEQHYLDKVLVAVSRGTLEVNYSTGTPPEWYQTSSITSEDWDDPKNPSKWVMNVDVADIPLDQIKAQKEADLNAACEASIVSGFTSGALGSDHVYQSERDDQLNLIGAKEAGIDMTFKCHDVAKWAYRPHTAAELAQVFADGVTVKHGYLTTCDAKKSLVDAATTPDEVIAIVWE